MSYRWFFRPLLAAMIIFGPMFITSAQAQNSTPSQRVVASCVGYSSALADDFSGAGRNTPAWDGVFRPAREECLRRNGSENMPNGSMFPPFYVATGANNAGGTVICVGSGAANGQACWVEGNEGMVFACPLGAAILDSASLARICQAVPGLTVYVPGNGTAILQDIKPAMAAFFGCPAGQCLFTIANDNGGPHGGTGPAGPGAGKPRPTGPVSTKVKDLLGQCMADLARNGIDPTNVYALKICSEGQCVRAGYTRAECVAEVAKQLAELAAVLAAGGTAAKWLQKYYEPTKDLLADTLENIRNDPYAKPGLVVIGIALVTLVCIESGGTCLLLGPRLIPAAAGVMGIATSGGGNRSSSNNRAATAEQAITAYCRGVVTRAARNAGWTPAPAAVDGFTQMCARTVPGRADRQAFATAIVVDCDRAGGNAVRNAGAGTALETAYSRAANQCLRLRAAEAMNFGQVPELGGQFANRLTDELQSCAERAGLQWQGSDTTGAAIVPPGVRNGLAQMANCLKAWPATVP